MKWWYQLLATQATVIYNLLFLTLLYQILVLILMISFQQGIRRVQLLAKYAKKDTILTAKIL